MQLSCKDSTVHAQGTVELCLFLSPAQKLEQKLDGKAT